MAARLNRVRCNIVTGDGELAGVSLQIPDGQHAIVRRGRDVLSDTQGVSAVRNVAPGRWEVSFVDGAIWVVLDVTAPCGSCG